MKQQISEKQIQEAAQVIDKAIAAIGEGLSDTDIAEVGSEVARRVAAFVRSDERAALSMLNDEEVFNSLLSGALALHIHQHGELTAPAAQVEHGAPTLEAAWTEKWEALPRQAHLPTVAVTIAAQLAFGVNPDPDDVGVVVDVLLRRLAGRIFPRPTAADAVAR